MDCGLNWHILEFLCITTQQYSSKHKAAAWKEWVFPEAPVILLKLNGLVSGDLQAPMEVTGAPRS